MNNALKCKNHLSQNHTFINLLFSMKLMDIVNYPFIKREK